MHHKLYRLEALHQCCFGKICFSLFMVSLEKLGKNFGLVWKCGRMEVWQNGSTAEKKYARMEVWQNGSMKVWKYGRMEV